MKSDDRSWVALIDPEFSVVDLNSGRGGRQVQYLDAVTGWRGDLVLRFREAAAAFHEPTASEPSH